MGTKAIRFSDKEEKSIKEFLDKNPMLDFSTLARFAIQQFMKNPQLEITPLHKLDNNPQTLKLKKSLAAKKTKNQNT